MQKTQFDKGKLTDTELLALYEGILLPRMIEDKMLILLRQGRISKWFSGYGQEAIAVGSTLALDVDDYIMPMHRNLGVFTSRKVPLDRLFGQFQGKASGYTKGRDRSFHFGVKDFHIVGMISHLGAQFGVADGVALAEKLSQSGKVAMVFSGEGGTSEGDFHEALNVAAVWDLPVIFIVENNGYGLSTPSSEQFRFNSFLDKGPAYGVEALRVDGNNILEVYSTIRKLAASIRKMPRPILIEAVTFRIRGHEEASGTKYVPKELIEAWASKDPVENYEVYLKEIGLLDDQRQSTLRQELMMRIEEGLEAAFASEYPSADIPTELQDLFVASDKSPISPENPGTSKKRYVDAISDGLRQSLRRHSNLIVMGQDVAEYGGVFKVTEGFIEEFGKERIRNTPLCESAILGMAVGLSVKGYKSVIEMQFADFVTCGFNQIVNNIAKIHYRWSQNADVVIRMPTGAGVGAGPFHSQSNEAWFFHTPGLKIVYPATASDAKGLLAAAIEDPNPVMYFEHKKLYRSVSEEVPDDYYTVPIGKGRLVQEGRDLSVVTYGAGVHWAIDTLQRMPEVKADILDLRSLMPWDTQAVKETVMKTGKVLILHEDTLSGGIGGEISAWISEHMFKYLDGPVIRVASLDTPVPFTEKLEAQFLPNGRLEHKIKELIEF